MDVRMPEMEGPVATARLAEVAPSTSVIILTSWDLDEYVLDAIRAGASGFLLKDAPPEEILTAVRRVAAGDAVIAPSATKRLLGQFATLPASSAGIPGSVDFQHDDDDATSRGGSGSMGRVRGLDEPDRLARTGRAGLLGVDSTGPGSRSPGNTELPGTREQRRAIDSLTPREREVLVEMARGLANLEIAEKLFVSEATVKTHVNRVLAKLGARDRVQAVITAFETGLA
ncbi:MAG: response regulator transcription factor [Promicromonosporaceae bacterium]|nr:response regulator transcription factor [Promicromonosporaceae bacterium]